MAQLPPPRLHGRSGYHLSLFLSLLLLVYSDGRFSLIFLLFLVSSMILYDT
jgi:hypothetical protein